MGPKEIGAPPTDDPPAVTDDIGGGLDVCWEIGVGLRMLGEDVLGEEALGADEIGGGVNVCCEIGVGLKTVLLLGVPKLKVWLGGDANGSVLVDVPNGLDAVAEGSDAPEPPKVKVWLGGVRKGSGEDPKLLVWLGHVPMFTNPPAGNEPQPEADNPACRVSKLCADTAS